MSFATRNENGDNMGNTFVRCPVEDKQRFAANWDRIFGTKSEKVKVWTDEYGDHMGTVPGPQVSVRRKDGSVVTTFEREVRRGPAA